MTWKRGGPVDPKYRSPQHRRLRAQYVKLIKAGRPVKCVAKICVMHDRAITNTNGLQPDGLHLGHNDDGITYRGPEHRACNVKDGARRGNARSRGTTPRRWIL